MKIKIIYKELVKNISECCVEIPDDTQDIDVKKVATKVFNEWEHESKLMYDKTIHTEILDCIKLKVNNNGK